MFVGARTRFVIYSFVFAMAFSSAVGQGTPPASTQGAGSLDAPVAHASSDPNIAPRLGGAKNNFRDFTHQLFSPSTVLLPAFTAGVSTATADSKDPFGNDAEGYGHRYGVYLADTGSAKFLRAFAMPTIFNQVEHYYPAGPDRSVGSRLGHAFVHTFVSKTRGGKNTFNMSGIPASFAVGAIGTYYYPGRYDSGWHVVQRAAWMQGGYFAQDLWREFRPQICRATHLPCGRHEP
jgi:hypothetical protein